MKITERELEDFLYDNLQKNRKEYLIKLGLTFMPQGKDNFEYVRQMNLGDYGRCDILGLCIEENNSSPTNYSFKYNIIELKEGDITKDVIFQCLKYRKALEEKASCAVDCNYGDITIIGSHISKDVFDLIKLTMDVNVNIYLYSTCLYNGIKFKYINDSHFFNFKCCEDECNPDKYCDGSCCIILSSGNSLDKKISEIKIINGIKNPDLSNHPLFSIFKNK